jgi:hypothetical protein
MKLEDKSTKDLLALHNAIADTPAGPKTFSTRAKLIARIRAVATAKSLDPDTWAASTPQASAAQVVGRDIRPATAEEGKRQKKHGLGIGELARMFLMDPAGYPHSLVAAMVNAQIPGAAATDKSVRWYASKMREQGIEVPSRHKAFPADLNEQQTKEWLATVTVVKGPTE